MYYYSELRLKLTNIMATTSYGIICVVIVNLLGYGCCQQFVGDYCTVPGTGETGVCQVITNCPAAIQNLGKGISPHICGFQGADSVVCCLGATSSTKPTSPPNKVTPTTPPAPIKPPTPHTATTATPTSMVNKNPNVFLRVGDKSRAKCKEYVEYAYTYAVAGAPPTSDCAITQVPLIVGGETAKEKEFPHMALIGFDGENGEKTWQCGGSLVSEQFVLTAGHCLYAQQYGEVKYIRLGEMDLNSHTEDVAPQDFNVNKIFRHPDYRPPSRYNDIALLKMDRKALLSPYVRPACLQTNPNINVTWKPLASGWGKLGWSADTSNTLQKVTLEYFTNAECNNKYKSDIGMRLRNGIVDNTQICAGSHNESKDTCQGDSGGPLQVVSAEEFCMYNIVGVTSFGKACGVVNIPGVYTRVSSYIKWIEDTVWP